MIRFRAAQTDADLEAILALQQANLPHAISQAEALEQGFLTVQHELPLLRDMNARYGHTMATSEEGELAGFALVMERSFGSRIPVLVPMFELFESLSFQGTPLAEYRYFVMGQVCVAKDFRGQGIFEGLYHNLADRLHPHFDLIVTEISSRNTRSQRAHEKVGFQTIHTYTVPDGETWLVVAWPISR